MTWRVRLAARLGSLTLDLALEGGTDPVAIVGPNGSGKTTLLRFVAGAFRPEEGFVAVGSDVLFDSSVGIDVPIEQRRVGYVPQGYGLFPHLDVVGNIAFGLRRGRRGPSRATSVATASAVLEELQASRLLDRRPAGLSGGEAQRVALARALVLDPAILLLDEPLAAMDASARRELRSLLARKLREGARPAIVVTHDARDVAALDAVVHVIERGTITQSGTLEALRASPSTDFVAEFAGA